MSNPATKYALGFLYGAVFASLGVTYYQPVFWLGIAFGLALYYTAKLEDRP